MSNIIPIDQSLIFDNIFDKYYGKCNTQNEDNQAIDYCLTMSISAKLRRDEIQYVKTHRMIFEILMHRIDNLESKNKKMTEAINVTSLKEYIAALEDKVKVLTEMVDDLQTKQDKKYDLE